jgi:hypothetical protein
MLKLTPSQPFSRVGLGSVIPHGSISLPVTFGPSENYRTESVIFDVTEVNLPFNAIVGRPALYQFMAVAHYRYLILKMSSPNGIIKVHGDRSTGVSALEKLQALAAAHEATAGHGEQDQMPSSSRQRGSTFVPHVQPSDSGDVPVKVIQISTDATQTTLIMGNLGDK